MLAHCIFVLFLAVLPLASPAKVNAMDLRQEADGSSVPMSRVGDVSVSSLLPVVEHQAFLIQSVQAELVASKNRISDLENNVTSLRAASTPVAFSARISADRDAMNDGIPLGHHQTVVFNQAITNIGNAYNTNSGIFTAPVAGSYAFFLNQMTPNQHDTLVLSIVKNRATILDRVLSKGKNIHEIFDQGTSLVTTHLDDGDQVCVQQVYGDAVRGDDWTIFSGFLLQAD